MKKLFAALLALALLTSAAATAEFLNLPPLSQMLERTPEPTEEPTPEATPEPTPDPVEVARQALIAEVTGDWYLNAFVLEGTSFAPQVFGSEMTLSLKEEGAASADYGEADSAREGTWDVQNDRVIVTVGAITREFILQEDGTLSTDIEGGSMVLGREPVEAEAFEPARAVSAELEQFTGEWRTYQVGVDDAFYDIALFGQEITATIDEGSIALTGYVFTGLSAQAELVDGALRFTAADDEGGMFDGITAQLLADGSLSLTLSAGEAGGFVLVMSRVEPLN